MLHYPSSWPLLRSLQCLHIQPPKIIMTGLKCISLTISFKIDLLGQKYFVLLSIGMLQKKIYCPRW
jgi:hypothetical protein